MITANQVFMLYELHSRGSIKATARELKISYKAVWKNIEAIDESLGFPVFERIPGLKGGVKLTAKGIYYFEPMFDAIIRIKSQLAKHEIQLNHRKRSAKLKFTTGPGIVTVPETINQVRLVAGVGGGGKIEIIEEVKP